MSSPLHTRLSAFKTLVANNVAAIRQAGNDSWLNINLTQPEPRIIHDYFKGQNQTGLAHLNNSIATHFYNHGFEVKFAGVFCHGQPLVKSFLGRADNLTRTPIGSNCELGDLHLVFTFLDQAKNLRDQRSILFQAKKKALSGPGSLIAHPDQSRLYESADGFDYHTVVFGSRNWPKGETLVVSQKCVQWSGFNLAVARTISDESVVNYGEERFLVKGDLLWNSTGTGTAGRIIEFPGGKKRVVTDSHVTVIRLTNFIPAYVRCFIASPVIQQRMEPGGENTLVTGTTNQVELPTSKVAGLPIPCPPVQEQRRIVAKVNELMALCDRLETQQQERQKLFPILSQVSHESFTGAPNAANFDRMFDKLGTVSADDLRKTIRTLAIDGKLFKMRSGQSSWPKLKLKNVCSLITDGEHATPQRTSSGILLATAKNIRDGFLNLTNTDWVSVETAKKCWSRCKPQNDDVLMVCVGATIGRLCLVQNPPDMVLVRSVALLRPNTEIITPAYLDHFLRSPLGQKQIWAGVKQNAQPCLYLGRMNEFELLVPPLAEQRRIVAKVDQLMALVDTLEKQQQERDHLAEIFAKAVVASLTGTQIAEKKEKMKAPKTELISTLQLGTKPKAKDDAPLATLLIKAKGELT
jgi:type I restriction enzyme S subunit